MTICAGGGGVGGGGNRSRAWAVYLQQGVCDRFGLRLTVCHSPPGCPKWDPIGYRRFGRISRNWGGRPRRSVPVMLAYIRGTTTAAGSAVGAVPDEGVYRRGRKVVPAGEEGLRIEYPTTNPQWNYTISPNRRAGG